MRPRTSLMAIGTSLCAVGLAHCSLTNSLDSLGNGPPDASVDGALQPAVDASRPADAGADTAVLESDSSDAPDTSQTPHDAGLDAFDSAPPHAPPTYLDAGATSWCTGHTTSSFCADFDEIPLPAGFPSVDGALLSLTSAVASSSPNDLLLWVPAQDGSSTFASKLSRNFTEHASTLTAAFDLDPEVLNTTTSGILFFALDFLGNSAAKYSVRLAFNGAAARVEESYLGGGSDVYHPSFTIPTAVWTRVRVQLAFGADGGASTIGVYLDGVLQGATDALLPPADFDTRPSVLVGAVYGTMPHTGWVLRYDNVTIDIQ